MEGTLATILMFGGNFAPAGWALCQGQLLAISQNTAVFALIGTNFGGNGQSNFALPDLRGRVPLGAGQGPGLPDYVLGEQIGSETGSLQINNIPAHNHVVTFKQAISSHDATQDEPTGNIPCNVGPNLYAAPNTANTSLAASTLTIQASTGSSQPFNLMQPVLCLSFVFCLQGMFPSRN